MAKNKSYILKEALNSIVAYPEDLSFEDISPKYFDLN